jgi:hypothetical protein
LFYAVNEKAQSFDSTGYYTQMNNLFSLLDGNVVFIEDNAGIVTAIWVSLELIVSAATFNQIAVTFGRMGKEYVLMLADWNSFYYFALADRDKVREYLLSRFK